VKIKQKLQETEQRSIIKGTKNQQEKETITTADIKLYTTNSSILYVTFNKFKHTVVMLSKQHNGCTAKLLSPHLITLQNRMLIDITSQHQNAQCSRKQT